MAAKNASRFLKTLLLTFLTRPNNHVSNSVRVSHLLPVLHLALSAAVVDKLALAALLQFFSSVPGMRPGVGNTVDTLLG